MNSQQSVWLENIQKNNKSDEKNKKGNISTWGYYTCPNCINNAHTVPVVGFFD